MPRRKSYKPEALAERTLHQFWHCGYQGSSIDDLVRATGVSRHGLYAEFGGKKGALLKAIDLYGQQIVTAAFGPVEQPGATLAEIATFFETQIAAGEKAGLPGPGCLMANLSTETAPRDPDIRSLVEAHNRRLKAGFAAALRATSLRLSEDRADALADGLVVFATGLWSLSRVTEDAACLRRATAQFLSLLEREIT